LEHKVREVKRLQQELDLEKNAREEAEREGGRARDVARELRRERIMDRAREYGRREGFEKGFMKAQAENEFKVQMQVEGNAASAGPNAAGGIGAGPSSSVGSGALLGTGPATVSGRQRRPSAAGAPKMELEQDLWSRCRRNIIRRTRLCSHYHSSSGSSCFTRRPDSTHENRLFAYSTTHSTAVP